MKNYRLLILISLISPLILYGQFKTNYNPDKFINSSFIVPDSTRIKDCEQKDIFDLLRRKKNRDKPRKKKKYSLFVIPNIAVNPANGFLLGVGGAAGWYLGNQTDTRVSSAAASIAVTSKNQLISYIKSNIYTPNDKLYLQGDWRYYIYSNPTYGLGTNAPDTTILDGDWIWQGANTDDSDGGFPMNYTYVKFHQTASHEVLPYFYVGLGYHLDYYNKIEDNSLKLDTLPLQLTPHYIYNKRQNFDTSSYMISGLSLNLFYDSRDNQINPYSGYFANINFRVNPTFLGSDQLSSQLWLEFRYYHGLSKAKPRHLIGFWFYGNFLISGNQPYMTLMALAEDQKARSGRGYIQGRYRGEDYIYGEVEYRFPISQCSQILGGVVFVNATTASNRANNVHLFQYVRPSFGFGLRLMLSKYIRTNLNIDFAFGIKSRGFYLSGTETF